MHTLKTGLAKSAKCENVRGSRCSFVRISSCTPELEDGATFDFGFRQNGVGSSELLPSLFQLFVRLSDVYALFGGSFR